MLAWGAGRAGSSFLDLDIAPVRTGGRASLPLTHGFSRELEVSDLARLDVEQGIKAPSLKRITDSHHGLARCLASGKSPGEASIITGFCASRISILKADPAFQELLEFYRSNQRLAETQVLDRLSTLSLDALEEIRSRIHDAPEDIRTRELLDIATAGLDRTGFGPSAKLQVTSLTLTAEDMERLSQGSKDSNVTVLENRPQDHRAGISRTEHEPLAEDLSEGIESQRPLLREEGRERTEAPDGEWRTPPGRPSFRIMAEVPGQERTGVCSAGSFRAVSGHDTLAGVQAETEYSGGGTAPVAVPSLTGAAVLPPCILPSSIQPLALQAEQDDTPGSE